MLRMAGWAVMLLAFVYLGRTLLELNIDELTRTLNVMDWLAVGAASFAYALALSLLAEAWRALADTEGRLGLRAALDIYGPAVIAKYLPGSIFQYASRQIRGAGWGLSHTAMAKASAGEAAIHVPSVLLVSAILLLGGGSSGVLVLVALAVAIAATARVRLVRATALQLVFFGAFVVLLLFLAAHLRMFSDADRIVGLFMIAWVAGFLVPVAPGGIGVREAAFLALMSAHDPAQSAALFAVLVRLVTLSGDALFGVAGYRAVSRRPKTQAST